MSKFLDATGITHLWGKITEWVNGLGLSSTEIDNLTGTLPVNEEVFDFPKITLEPWNPQQDPSKAMSFRLRNGSKYTHAGYVPILFTQRSRRHSYGTTGSGCNLDWVYHNFNQGLALYETVCNVKEWRRYANVFVECNNDDGACFILTKDMTPLGSIHDVWHTLSEYFYEESYPLGYVLVPPISVAKNDYGFCNMFQYNNKLVAPVDPWLMDKIDWRSQDVATYAFNALTRHRDLTFNFKLGFCPNWFYLTLSNGKYDPTYPINNQPNVELCRGYDDVFYIKSDFIWNARVHKFTLNDIVSNIIDINVKIHFGEHRVPFENFKSGNIEFGNGIYPKSNTDIVGEYTYTIEINNN